MILQFSEQLKNMKLMQQWKWQLYETDRQTTDDEEMKLDTVCTSYENWNVYVQMKMQ